jgi:hypothetical protein
MKRPKIKPPKPALPSPCPGQLSLLEYGDRVSRLIAETNADPDYQRLFAELLEQEYGNI